LSLAVLYVAESLVPIMRDFYSTTCSWPVSVDVEGYAELETGTARLGIWSFDRVGEHVGPIAAGRARREATRVELYVHVAQGDLEAALERAAQSGGRVLAQPEVKDWGDRVAYVLDPAGQVLALAEQGA
jgi:predicted enzyme related to lactoylglutathione lyase